MELMLEILWARKALAASFESSLEVVGIVRMLIMVMVVVMFVNQVLILMIPTWTRCSW